MSNPQTYSSCTASKRRRLANDPNAFQCSCGKKFDTILDLNNHVVVDHSMMNVQTENVASANQEAVLPQAESNQQAADNSSMAETPSMSFFFLFLYLLKKLYSFSPQLQICLRVC